MKFAKYLGRRRGSWLIKSSKSALEIQSDLSVFQYVFVFAFGLGKPKLFLNHLKFANYLGRHWGSWLIKSSESALEIQSDLSVFQYLYLLFGLGKPKTFLHHLKFAKYLDRRWGSWLIKSS